MSARHTGIARVARRPTIRCAECHGKHPLMYRLLARWLCRPHYRRARGLR